MWQPSTYYPDPAVQVLHPSFNEVSPAVWPRWSGWATGLRWAEGPVWFGDARHLLVSDIPNNRIVKWDEATGLLSDLPPAQRLCQREYAGICRGG